MGALLPELETERLTVRLARPGMHAAMARFLAENFEGHLERWSPPATSAFFTEEFWRERLAVAVEEFHAGRAARFVLQARGETAPRRADRGHLQLHQHRARPVPRMPPRLPGRARHEGQGLMAEALRATNAFVFDSMRLHRIMANYRPENERSGRLLERLGFAREGLARDYLFIDGAWRDHVLTALINPRFDPPGSSLGGPRFPPGAAQFSRRPRGASRRREAGGWADGR